jgi:phage FluMu protein Com
MIMGSREIPDEAYYKIPCPYCEGVVIDMMGDAYCMECNRVLSEDEKWEKIKDC